MRVQLNKYGLEPVDYGEGIEYRYWVQHAGNAWKLGSPDGAYVARFCKKCGAELFGKWSICSFHYNSEVKDRDKNRIKARQEDPKRFNYINEQYRLMEDAEKRYRFDFDLLHSEAATIQNLNTCPCCSATLSKKDGYFAALNICDSNIVSWEQDAHYRTLYNIKEGYAPGDEVSIDDIFSAMSEFRKGEQTEIACKNAADKIAQFEDTAPVESILGHTGIKDHPEKLKEYILKLIHTEANILSLTKRLQSLYLQRIDTDRAAYGSTLPPLPVINKEIPKIESQIKELKRALELLDSKPIPVKDIPQPALPVEPRYAQPAFLNKKRNAALKAEYDRQMEQYRQAIECRKIELSRHMQEQTRLRHLETDEIQKKIQAAEVKLKSIQTQPQNTVSYSADMVTPEKAHKILLDREIQQTEDLLQKAVHCKHQLYNHEIIFEKYRNLVAISTFYEYLMAGRCTTLEGINGAYNLYESELRANIIISQLNNVLESLDRIKENQFMIYSAIQKANATLERLDRTMEAATKSLYNIEANSQTMTKYMEQIAANSDVIAHNTAVNAYYSKVNAELTDALGYMTAMR